VVIADIRGQAPGREDGSVAARDRTLTAECAQ